MKSTKILMALFLPLMLTGCMLNTGIDTLLSPPKLDARQEHIYSALKSYTGDNISLKYPKSGKNLSAFIIDDIDDDSQDEAIVFYKKNVAKTADNPLRINILDSTGSDWYSVYDHPVDGNEVEQVEVTKLGDSEKTNIIVGYSLINRSDKKISIYDYADGKLNTSLGGVPYSVFDTTDLNNDGLKELFTATINTNSGQATAELYHLYENGTYKCSEQIFDENYIKFHKISWDTNNGENLFLDCETLGGEIATEVLTTDGNGNLLKAFSPDIKKHETMRPPAYLSKDIDGDGEIEIPYLEFFDGYDENSENAVYLTLWYGVQNGKLKFKYESYCSITDEYVFMIPRNWYGKITAKNNIAENELTLLSGNDPETGEEIFTLKVVSGNDEPIISEKDDYVLLRTRGDKSFFLKINKSNPLALSLEELMMKFKFE